VQSNRVERPAQAVGVDLQCVAKPSEAEKVGLGPVNPEAHLGKPHPLFGGLLVRVLQEIENRGFEHRHHQPALALQVGAATGQVVVLGRKHH